MDDRLRQAIKASLILREKERLRGSKRTLQDSVKLAQLAKAVFEEQLKQGRIQVVYSKGSSIEKIVVKVF